MLYKRIYNQRIELDSFIDDVYIKDTQGKRYLDLIGGSGTNYLVRYGDKEPMSILTNGLSRCLSCTNFLNHNSREKLADKLKELTSLNVALFVCSGSEGNEAAIKLSLKRHFEMGKTNKNMIAFRNGCYFGRTYFSACSSNNQKYFNFLGDKRQGFVGFDNAKDLLEWNLNDFSCIVLECFSSRELKGLSIEDIDLIKRLQSEYDIDLIVDEVKSGCGRTGSFLSTQKFGLSPDMVVGMKSLAAGLPLMSVMVADKFIDFIDTNWHSSTTGGNPAFCDLALYLLDSSGVCKKGDLSNSKNRDIEDNIKNIVKDKAEIIRIGDWWNVVSKNIEMARVADKMYDNGIIPYYIGKNYFSLLPSRYFTNNHWDEFLDKFGEIWI